jgi:hypothetical protein
MQAVEARHAVATAAAGRGAPRVRNRFRDVGDAHGVTRRERASAALAPGVLRSVSAADVMALPALAESPQPTPVALQLLVAR